MLRSFLHMLLDGSGIDPPPPGLDKSQVATSNRQQIIFNSKKTGFVPRPIKERKTPVSLYLAMKLHLQTSSRSLVVNSGDLLDGTFEQRDRLHSIC